MVLPAIARMREPSNQGAPRHIALIVETACLKDVGGNMTLADELLRIRALLLQGDLAEAGKVLKTIQKTDVDHWELKQLRGWWYHNKGKVVEETDASPRYFKAGLEKFRQALTAIETLQAAMTEDKAETIQGIVACLRLLGELDTAEDELQDAIGRVDTRGLRCEWGWLWNARSEREIDTEQFMKAKEEAAKAFERALEKKDPKNPQRDDDFIWPAQFWREAGKLDKAEKILLSALPQFADQARLYVEYGWVNFYRRDFSGAGACFDRALKANPKLDTALQGKVAVLREVGCLDDAMAILDGLTPEVQAVPGLRSERAWIMLARRQPEEAAKIFEDLANRADAAKSKDSAVTKAKEDLNRAFCLLETGTKPDRLQAIELCRPLCYGPLAAQAYGCLGVATFRNRDVAASEYYLMRSVETNKHLGWHADLVRLYTFLGRIEEAKKVLVQALGIKPNELELLDAAGELFTQAGDLSTARDYYRQGLRLAPNSLACLSGLGETLLALKETEAAETLLRKGLPHLHVRDQPPARLVLVRILCEAFQQTTDMRFLDEALIEVHHNNQQGNLADAKFHEGVVRFRRGELWEARAAFVRANNIERNPLAEINAERIRVILNTTEAGKLGRWSGRVIFMVALCQVIFMWLSWMQAPAARWFTIPDSAALVLIPLTGVMMVAGLSLPFLTKLSVSGVEIELAQSGSGQKPEGPVGHISFYGKLRGGGLAH